MIEPTVLAFLAGFCHGCIVMLIACLWWAMRAMHPHSDVRPDAERAEGIE